MESTFEMERINSTFRHLVSENENLDDKHRIYSAQDLLYNFRLDFQTGSCISIRGNVSVCVSLSFRP